MQERKEAKRKHILETAIVVFSEKGYQGTRVSDIVQRAGVSVGSFYFYFPGKEGIFLALLEELAAELQLATREARSRADGTLHQMEASITAFVRNFARHRAMAKILLIEAAASSPALERKRMEVLATFADGVRSAMDEAVAQGIVPPLDTAIASHAWVGAINQVVTRWLVSGEPQSLEEAIPTLVSFNLRGLGVKRA